MKSRFLALGAGSVLGACALVGPVAGVAVAQTPPASSNPRPPSFYEGGEAMRDLLPAAARSLPRLRLHEAALPQEAEISCSLMSTCDFGLTRGLALSIDATQFINSTLFKSTSDGRSWLALDASGGYQILRDDPASHFSNARLGYRLVRYKDSSGTLLKTEGVSAAITYAHELAPRMVIGLSFSGVPAQRDRITPGQDNWALTPVARANMFSAIRSFYKYAGKWPRLRVGVPVDLEAANVLGSDIGIPESIHFYARAEPFFAQYELDLNDDLMWREQLFGVRLAVSSAYETKPEARFGRIAAMVALGIDAGLSGTRFTHEGDYSDVAPLPKHEGVDFYGDVRVSWQF